MNVLLILLALAGAAWSKSQFGTRADYWKQFKVMIIWCVAIFVALCIDFFSSTSENLSTPKTRKNYARTFSGKVSEQFHITTFNYVAGKFLSKWESINFPI